ncbi:hypothetical protein [Streptomyces flavalbus]|uniref:AB hydrolase-1 domain-containing protein n=1 Tax=Streptomyces flavalbus TaxID=2665155 RepID=A0ABW2W6I8_9ACTN
MTSVLFIHGTGVRAPEYAAALRTVRAGLARVRSDVTVAECDWGSALGSYLRAEGMSIPGYRPRKTDTTPRRAPDDEERARWALLYAEPDAELTLFALSGPTADTAPAPFVPGRVPAGQRLRRQTAGLADVPAVREAWEAAGLAGQLGDALRELRSSAVFGSACGALDDGGGGTDRGLPRLTGRSLVARALAQLPEGPGAVPVAARDAAVDAVTDALGGDERGIGEVLGRSLGAFARLAERAGGSRLVVSQRGPISGHSLGFSGDILSYLVRGAAVRAYVADLARRVPAPVVLLGHSLGGVIAFDLMAGGTSGPLPPPPVAQLITVGSQAPLLYELDALPSRPYGTGLPAAFPEWLNVYDRRDLLSFLGSPIFGSRVRDVEVDNGQPVSAAHSAYWANPRLYEVLAQALPG